MTWLHIPSASLCLLPLLVTALGTPALLRLNLGDLVPLEMSQPPPQQLSTVLASPTLPAITLFGRLPESVPEFSPLPLPGHLSCLCNSPDVPQASSSWSHPPVTPTPPSHDPFLPPALFLPRAGLGGFTVDTDPLIWTLSWAEFCHPERDVEALTCGTPAVASDGGVAPMIGLRGCSGGGAPSPLYSGPTWRAELDTDRHYSGRVKCKPRAGLGDDAAMQGWHLILV